MTPEWIARNPRANNLPFGREQRRVIDPEGVLRYAVVSDLNLNFTNEAGVGGTTGPTTLASVETTRKCFVASCSCTLRFRSHWLIKVMPGNSKRCLTPLK
jgi:hypothetical protein